MTYAEVSDHLPDEFSDPDQIEDIIQMISDLGIVVYEHAPDVDELLVVEENTTDDVAADEAVAALVAVERDVGRTTDAIRMYMREMGSVALLTREGEITLAKRIEEGHRDVLSALSYYPGTVEYLLETYATADAKGCPGDVLIGYLDPMEVVPAAPKHQPDISMTGKGDDAKDEEKEKRRILTRLKRVGDLLY
jgi:RNA polymerase primary sigma factor